MNIPQLLKDRGRGSLRLVFARSSGDSLQALISTMGFDFHAEELTPIDVVEAEAALSRLFHRDLAYGVSVMDTGAAQTYAREVISEYAPRGTTIYTNAQWDEDKLTTWNPVTAATFNVLILIVRNGFAMCVLVEDED